MGSAMDLKDRQASFVIVGGGIAGVSCAEALTYFGEDKDIILITKSPLIKVATNVVSLTKTLCQFDVEEKSAEILENSHSSISVVLASVMEVDYKNKMVITDAGHRVRYEKLCICSGGYPKVISKESPYVIGIRDTESVQEFQKRIKDARRILLVGNGGIATEIVYEIEGVDIVWAIKDKHISATFVDPGAAEFFQSKIKDKSKQNDENPETAVKRLKYTVSDTSTTRSGGAALGPDWHTNYEIHGARPDTGTVTVEYQSEVKNIWDAKEVSSVLDQGEDECHWPVYVELTNGKVLGCDFIVSATGVIPNVVSFKDDGPALQLAEDGGIKVDWKMETTVPDVFAAGDVCTASWDIAQHWFQMRLWTQARQMGMYAAKCMACSLTGEEIIQDFCFELFSHVTKFFGYKVVLLGLYNGQKLGGQYEVLLRMTKGMEYIKLVVKDGQLHGAVLIGETDLEEMCENLILNQLDISSYGEDILNPDIDIEDYFD